MQQTATNTEHGGTLERIAALASRLLELPLTAVYSLGGGKPQLRASSGPVVDVDWELRELVSQFRNDLIPGEPMVIPPELLAQRNGALRLCVCVLIPSWDGAPVGILAAAGVRGSELKGLALAHLADLAGMAGNEIELERRRNYPGQSTERRKTQEQLLEKTLELAKYGEDLRQLHRLSTTNHDSLEHLFNDYLDTGRAVLGMSCGVVIQVRGRYAVVRAISSDGIPVRPATTFELCQAYCGLVCDERTTVACSWVGDHPQLAARPHYTSVKQAAYIGTPIVVDGETFGVLSFSSAHARWRPFSSHETELIELMAKSIGRSILEVRMQDARHRAELLDRDRSQVLEMVAKDLPLSVVLAQIANMVERQSASLAVAIHEVREGNLYCVAAPTMPEQFRKRMQGVPLSNGERCCLIAAFTRKIEVFESAHAHCDLQGPWASIHEYCWQACGAAPVISGSGELLGVITVYWKVAVQPRHVDAELLEMAGSLAAIGIEHRRLTDRLAFQAHHDILTGLPNRSLLTRVLAERIERADNGGILAVVFVDLDRFKQINDHLGHAAGDEVLRVTASRLASCLQQGEVAARIGGDEFVAVLTDACDETMVRSRARDILEAVRAPIDWNGQPVYITASLGLSLYPESGNTPEGLLGNADLAMYRVKNNGKNDVEWFDAELENKRLGRIELEHALRAVVDGGDCQQLSLNFQPIVDIRGAEGISLEGFEVLLSWEHPSLGRVSPLQFIPIAEECGLIGSIGSWVLRKACLQGVAWQQAGFLPIRISVNVSARQFDRADFVDTVEAALFESGLDGRMLELELTESAIMEDIAAATPKLQRLRMLGVRLSLDDFGTGYSSLGYLRWIPVDCLKIDHTFLAEIDASAGAFTLVQTIVALAHNMGLTVVAEGVENERQLELLRGINCDMAQGHLFGTPLPASAVERLLAAK
jgi:diguanylate cyclase (GGDEF)-like protein